MLTLPVYLPAHLGPESAEGGPEQHSGAASVSGGGTLTAAGQKDAAGAAAVSGGGSLIAEGRKEARGAASVSGGGGVTAQGTASETPTGPTFSSDSFTDPDGTSVVDHIGEVGATWTRHGTLNNGNAVIRNGRIVNETTNPALLLASGVPAGQAYDVEADLYTASTLAAVNAIAACIDPVQDTQYLWQLNRQSGTWRLVRVVNGAVTVLGSWADVPPVGSTRRMTLRIRPGTVEGLVDGISRVGPVADTTIGRSGRVGIRLGSIAGSATTGQHLDNFRAANAATASGAVSVSGGGSVTAEGRKDARGAAAVSGGGTVTAEGTANEVHAGAVSVSGGGGVAAAGQKEAAGAASISAGGEVVATGRKSVAGAASVSGGGLVLVSGRKLARGTVYVTGGGTVTAAGFGPEGPPPVPVTLVGVLTLEPMLGAVITLEPMLSASLTLEPPG